MPRLDFPTLSLFAVFSTLLMALGIRLAVRLSEPSPDMRAWSIGSGLWALGFVLLLVRGGVPEAFALVAGNTLVVVGLAWIYFGLRLTLGLPLGPRWDLSAGALVGGVSLYFSLVSANPPARVLIFSLLLSALAAAAAHLLLVAPVRAPSERRLLGGIGLAFAATSLLFAVRAGVAGALMAGWPAQGWADTVRTLSTLTAIALNMTLMLGLTHLVTSRYQRKLADSEARLRATLDHSPSTILVVDGQGRSSFVNRQLEALLGRGPQEVQLRPLPECLGVAPAAIDALVQQARERGHAQAELVLTHAQGHRVDAEVGLVLLPGGDLLFDLRSTRERRLAEAQAHRLAQAVEHCSEAIIIANERGDIEYVNAAFERISGFGRDEVRGMNPRRFSRGKSTEATYDALWDTVRQGQPWHGEFVNRRKDGTEYVERIHVAPIRLADGAIDAYVAVTEDVTERKRTEQALAESRNLLQQIIDTAPLRIFWKDTESRYLGCNPAFAADAGVADPAEVIGRTDFEMGWRDQAELYRADDRAVMGSGGNKIGYVEPQTTPDGATIWVRTSKVALRGADGAVFGLLGVYEDITASRQIELALQASEARSRSLAQLLRLMCDNVPDMIWAKDLDKRFLFANKAVCEGLLCATDTDEPIGKTDLFFALRQRALHPERSDWHTFGELCQDSDAVTLERGEASVFEEFGHVRGEMLYLDVHKAPFVDASGQVIGIVGSGRDVTARRAAEQRLQESESRTQAVFVGAQDGILVADVTTRRFVDVNPAICEMLGYSRDELLGLSVDDIHPPEDLPMVAETFARQARGEQHVAQALPVRRRDGSVFFADITAAPMALHGGRLVAGFFRDVTERRRVQAELDRHRHRLEEIVDERTQELTAAKAAAEAANVAKTAFLANMSHEIRTPLNAIAGMTYLMKREGVAPRQADRLDKIEAAGQHLLEIINAVLDLSKIEAGKLVLQQAPVAIDMLVGQVSAMLLPGVQSRGLRWLTDVEAVSASLLGDPTRLQQALLNYAGNAVKFTHHGGVTLRVRVEEDSADSVLCRFEVEDTGIGIAPDKVGALFNAFEQADNSTTREYGGTGLGLAINKQLARLMGGEVGVDSRLGSGSRFWFTARLRKSAPVPASRGPGNAASTAEQRIVEAYAGRRVLLVEDEPVNCEITRELLECVGQQVDVATDGADAVALASRQAYDLVLMDVQMPNVDGLEATRRIRALPAGATVPIIALTANAFAEDRARCIAAGMNDFVAKPIRADELFSTLLRWLSRPS